MENWPNRPPPPSFRSRNGTSSCDPTSFLTFAQYADSAYPAGGLAQSWGLETAVAQGHIRSVGDLESFVRSMLRHQTGRTDAVAAAGCCRAAALDDLQLFIAIDRRLTATKAAREAREGSSRMGRRLLETAAAAERDPWLDALLSGVRAGATPGNHAAALGAVAGRANLPPDAAAALSLWTALSGIVSAALRLIRMTHDDAQATLTTFRLLCAALTEQAVAADPLRIAASAPRAEIWAMRHEQAEVRLFAS